MTAVPCMSCGVSRDHPPAEYCKHRANHYGTPEAQQVEFLHLQIALTAYWPHRHTMHGRHMVEFIVKRMREKRWVGASSR